MFWKFLALLFVMGTLVSCNAKLDVTISGDASKIGTPQDPASAPAPAQAAATGEKRVITFSGASD